MSRFARTAALAAAAVAVGAPASAQAADPSVRLVACKTAELQADRAALFSARMDRRGATRMALRFDLFVRTPETGRFQAVDAPELGVWRRAARGVPSYRFRQRIVNLAAPAEYRVRVTFRWSTPGGKPVAVAQRWSSICVQPDPRPNLRVVRLAVLPETADAERVDYRVIVRNSGPRAVAGPEGFDVELRVAGIAVPAVTVSSLGAGQRAVLDIRAPRCRSGQSVSATADPDGRVDESAEDDNVLSLPCAPRP